MDGGTGRRLLARMATHGIAAIAAASGTLAGQAAEAPREKSRVEIIRFADMPVRVVRGAGGPVAAIAAATLPAAPFRPPAVERIAFAGAIPTSVTIVRSMNMAGTPLPADPVLPATARDFERIAEAVHGVESRYGADPNMWRPDPDGPQGPMQVSEAAARDTGGGNRFDLEQNRLLGRAYLARMLRRYGNWPEALAAYNWGPGNVDRWIAGGRDAGRVPRETTRYIERVLRDARVANDAGRDRLTITR